MDLNFERRGSGAPLVLLHGIGSRWQMWAPVLDDLAAAFDVWAVDLPGMGASPAPAAPIGSIGELTDLVWAWMDEYGLEGAHVAGNSTGAGVALELASRGVVASACALAPIGFWSRRERIWCQASVRNTRALSRLTRPLAPALARSRVARTLTLAQYVARPWKLEPDDVVGDIDALIGATSFDDVCAAFTGYVAPADAADRVPVTIAWGDKDRLLLPRQARRAQRLVPRARHVLLAGCGHLMTHDDPAAVAAVVRGAAAAPAAAAVGAGAAVPASSGS